MITRKRIDGSFRQCYINEVASLDPTPIVNGLGLAYVFKEGAYYPVLYNPSWPAEVDLPPELMETVRYAQRANKVTQAFYQRQAEKSTARNLGLSLYQYRKLQNMKQGYLYLKVLRDPKPSAFIKSIRAQIIEWVQQRDPIYTYPLSYKQYRVLIS